MAIFDAVDPCGGADTVEQAVGAVIECARRRGISPGALPWSIAELRADGADFDWLCRWAQGLESRTARGWLQNGWASFVSEGGRRVPQQAAIGLLLMMLAAEAARREATEKTLWPYVRHDRENRPRFQHEVEAELFDPGGQPTRPFKDAMESAADCFGLRNVFDDVETMRYYITIFLQFGFTMRDARRRLPYWLGGHPPQLASEHLLGSGESLESDSFRQLWHALRYHRSGNIRRDQLASILSGSPWVLPEWADELIELAARAVDTEEPLVCDDAPFLEGPNLRWDPPGAPRFACRVVNLAQLDLSEDEYDLRIAGRTCARLIRQSDDHYRVFPSDEVDLPVVAPTVAADLVARDGILLRSETLTCWDPGEDLTVFRLPQGRKLGEGEALRAGRDYAVLHATDLALEPDPRWYSVVGQARRAQISFLAGVDVPRARVRAGSSIFWPLASANRAGASEPPWAAAVLVCLRDGFRDCLALGTSFRLSVHHPTDVEVGFIRFGMSPVPFSSEGEGRTLSGRLELSPEMIRYPEVVRDAESWVTAKTGTGGVLEFSIGLRHGGETARVRRTLDFDGCGAAQLSADAWTALSERERIVAEDGRSDHFLIVPPWEDRGQPVALEEWAIMEGNKWVGRPRRRPQPLDNLAGLGARLTVRRGPFNALGDILVVAGEVVQHGLLRDIILPDGSDDLPRSLRLELTHPVEIDDRHKVIWWDRAGRVESMTPVPYNDGHATRIDWWHIEVPNTLTEPRAVAIAYSGHRKGAWWAWDWYYDLNELGDLDARGLATLLRWLRPPILGKGALQNARLYAAAHPVEVLNAWLLDADAPEPFRWNLADEGWLSAMREVFRDWRPKKDDVEAMIQVAEGRPFIAPPVVGLALDLVRVSPMLMGKVLKCWLHNCGHMVADPKSAKGLLWLLRCEIAGLSPGASQGSYEKARDTLLERCCYERRPDGHLFKKIDDVFISELLKASVGALMGQRKLEDQAPQEDNLDVAIGCLEGFRRLLSLCILDALIP